MVIRIKTNVPKITSGMEAYVMYIANKLQEIRFGKPSEVRILHFGELKTWTFWRAVLAEFVGTLLFVFLGCASAVPITGEPQSTIKIAFAFGISIMALIQMFGHISGGNFNPAVSFGLAASGIITPVRAVLYTVAQSVGAVLGGLILKGVTVSTYHSNLGVTSINPLLNVGQGFGVEVILTFVLVFVIIATIDSNRTDAGMASVAIGLTVAVCHLAGITYTGSSMNPARSLGSAVASNSFSDHWVYWVAPILGGVIAAVLYKFLFSPFRNAIPIDEAVNELLQDGDMIVIPKDYFTGRSQQKIQTVNSQL
ncbi:aquaporin AQPAn.G-like isoform X3 [Mytilus edulis]|uniref:aquaporin AQPAn.G-like isoform X3 n=1 Tax=Mytilus edulis TaxID=6550 RepID=UPI0039EE5AAA